MVRVLSLIMALVAGTANAAIIPTQQTFVACGMSVMLPPGISLPGPGVTSNSLVSLGCRATGANTYCSARRANDTQRYVVPTGKTFRLFHSCVNPGHASTDTGWAIGYGSSDVGFANSSAPTGASWAFNDQNNSQVNAGVFGSQLAPAHWMDYDIPTGKIPAAQTNASAYIWMYGYEY